MKHGTAGAYTNHACRCAPCTTANRAQTAEWRTRTAGTLGPGDVRHGTVNGYTNYRCRCDDCRAAQSRALRGWRDAT